MSHGSESKVVIEGVKQSREYVGIHAASGIISFLVARGILLVPIQNAKTRKQFNTPNITNEPLTFGLGQEMIIQFSNFFLRVGINSALKALKMDLPPIVPSVLSDIAVYPLVAKRVRSIVSGSGLITQGIEKQSWTKWLTSVATYLAYGILEEALYNVIFEKVSDSDILPIDITSSVYNERLVQGVCLGLSKVALSPLEIIYKNQMVFNGVPAINRNNFLSLYTRGSYLGILEGISLTYVKYAVFNVLNESLTKKH